MDSVRKLGKLTRYYCHHQQSNSNQTLSIQHKVILNKSYTEKFILKFGKHWVISNLLALIVRIPWENENIIYSPRDASACLLEKFLCVQTFKISKIQKMQFLNY